MKIAIIIDALNRGGAERQALLSVAELQKLGHTAEMIVYHPHREYTDLIERDNINLVEIKNKGFLRSGRILSLAKHFRKGRFDVVHAFGGTASLYAALAAKLAKVPVVLGGYRVEYKEQGLIKVSNRFTGKLVDGWIVNSKIIAESMAKGLGIDSAKFHVVRNGISPAQFQSNLSKEEAKQKLSIPETTSVITKVARLHPQKNHRMFLETAGRVHQMNPKTRFLVVGDGALKSELEKYANDLGVSAFTDFLGNRADMPDLLAATDVSVLTSDFEGFPNALIEAMSVNIPVVSTDYPGIDELITDGCQGLIAPRNNADEMASDILRLLDDQQLSKQIGIAGAMMVQNNLSPVTLAQNLVAVYEKYLNRNK